MAIKIGDKFRLTEVYDFQAEEVGLKMGDIIVVKDPNNQTVVFGEFNGRRIGLHKNQLRQILKPNRIKWL